ANLQLVWLELLAIESHEFLFVFRVQAILLGEHQQRSAAASQEREVRGWKERVGITALLLGHRLLGRRLVPDEHAQHRAPDDAVLTLERQEAPPRFRFQ